MNTQQLNEAIGSILSTNPWIVLLFIWAVIWKIIALWKAAKNDQLTMFIVLAVINTAGVLDIIYLIYIYRKNKNKTPITE